MGHRDSNHHSSYNYLRCEGVYVGDRDCDVGLPEDVGQDVQATGPDDHVLWAETGGEGVDGGVLDVGGQKQVLGGVEQEHLDSQQEGHLGYSVVSPSCQTKYISKES